MTRAPSDPQLSGDGFGGGDEAGPSGEEKPIVLVARIAEALPQLDARELIQLADAVEALTEAIGLRMDWSDEPDDG